MTKKTLLPTNDLYLQFTDEEIQELGWEAGQKLEVKQHSDGSIELRPYVKLELDMEEWPRETLEMIIKESLDQDISVNDVINNMLKQSLKNFESDTNLTDEEVYYDSTKSSYEDSGLKSTCGCSSHDAVLPTAFNSEYTTSSSDKLPTITKEKVLLNEYGQIDPNFTNNDMSFTESYAYKYHPERDMLFSPNKK